ncbi:hypothetical protein NSND_61180 [Nitrospira sp. ND1]|nr:hypothetical protein NSND_61180 [Nitrospira sp. ND1]
MQLCRRPTPDERRPSRDTRARPLALNPLEREDFTPLQVRSVTQFSCSSPEKRVNIVA